MATSFTYATLKSALQDITEDHGTEFEAIVDLLIPLAEDRILRDVPLKIFDSVDTVAMTPNSPYLNKPSGFVALVSLGYINDSDNYVSLEPKTFEHIRDYWPNSTSVTATPKYYAEYNNSGTPAWYLGGTPNTAFDATVHFVKRPTGMSSGNTTTWIGTNLGDLLLMACLVESEQFLKADDRIQMWKTDYMERLGAALNDFKTELRTGYMPLKQIPTKEE